jgi:hypothetical protein
MDVPDMRPMARYSIEETPSSRAERIAPDKPIAPRKLIAKVERKRSIRAASSLGDAFAATK